MKLKRKLLPIIGASAGIGATALALTGCSFFIGGGDSSWVNVMNRYVPSGFEQPSYDAISTETAVNRYHTALGAKDATLLREDYYWSSAQILAKLQSSFPAKQASIAQAGSYTKNSGAFHPGATMRAKKDKIKVSNIKVSDSVEPFNVDERKVYTFGVDYTLEYSYDYISTEESGAATLTRKQTLTGKTRITDLPYTLEYDTSTGLWMVLPASKIILDKASEYYIGHSWKIEVTGQQIMQQIGTGTEYGDITITQEIDIDRSFDSVNFLLGKYSEDDLTYARNLLNEDAWFYSWYMYNIACTDSK